jgi:endonuclease IV
MELLLGAHISIAWWIDKSFLRSNQIGWNTMQIFAKSPRWRKIPEINQEDIKNSLIERKKYAQLWWLIHSNYLANLSKPLQDCQTDIDSILHDLKIAQQTWFDWVNVHIWKWKWFLNKRILYIFLVYFRYFSSSRRFSKNLHSISTYLIRS